MDDILTIPGEQPPRHRGRPKPSEAELKRRHLAAWLVESGTLSREDVELLVNRRKSTVNLWRSAQRRAS